MKNNYSSSKNHKTSFVVLLLLFFGLFANNAAAQAVVANHDTYTWTGVTSSDWTNATNWSILRGTANAGIGTYPGEAVGTDVVFINNSGTPFPAILDGQIIDIARLNVTNALGGEAGATFTINAGAILNVGNYTLTVGTTNVTQSNNVLMSGGNIVNNGTLNITGRGVGFTSFPSYGINCGNPPVLPTVPREYTYSGTGTLTINLANANFAGAAAIAVVGASAASTGVAPIPFANNANVTYRLVLNNPEITLNQASTASIQAIRAAGGNNANKMIIAGTGLTYGTVGTPLIGGLINLGGGASLTIEAGTTLTLNSAATNTFSAISGFSGSTFATNFTNKGTINILGSSARSGMFFSTATALISTNNPAGISPIFNINNESTLNINLNITSGGQAGLTVGNGGGAASSAGVAAVNVNNTGTMTLKNTSIAVGSGFSIFTVTASEAAPLFFTNSGTLNLEGSTYNYGLKTTLNNSGILNTNSEFRSFTAINNNLGGLINFARTAATATTRQVAFTILTETDTSGALGSIYKDSNNNDYAIVAQKFSGGFALVANALSATTVPASGTLTRSTGAGSATIVYTAASLAPLNTATTGNVTNSGIINTDTASNLNILSLLATTATSVLSPGGDSGKGILTIPDFPSASADFLALLGTLKLQASGSATAGVDYDTMQVTGPSDVINVTGATLDVTGLYTPAVFTTIDIITTNTTVGLEGSVVGPFANVVGLPAKWTVVINPGLGNKAQLVYDPNLGTDKFAEAQFSYYPNPTRNELNLTAATTISTVEMFNLLGQKVLGSSVDANQKQLDLSNLPSGVYLMEVTIENNKESFKIMKQ
jgi:hypothetical protein